MRKNDLFMASYKQKGSFINKNLLREKKIIPCTW